MRRLAQLLALAAGACLFDPSGIDGLPGDGGARDAGAPDGAPDGAPADAPGPLPDAPPADAGPPDAVPPPDAPPPCDPWPWTPTNFDPCDPALPPVVSPLGLGAIGIYLYDTTTGELWSPGAAMPTTPPSAVIAQSGGPAVRVWPVGDLTVGGAATLQVQGDAPLILAVYGSASIAGVIDASARTLPSGLSLPGPGGNDPGECGGAFSGTDGQTSMAATAGAGGGGGGAYGGNGGDGGDGNGGGHGARGAKGTNGGAADLDPLRGGCGGGRGGDAEGDPIMTGAGGFAGAGGGGIQLAVRDNLALTGRIASGGAGGAILIEANALLISLTASVCANGGSGGEGAHPEGFPANGGAGTCSELMAASTLNLSPNGGNGGNGGYRSNLNGANASNGASGAGGGGGGGGVGRIRIRGVASETIDTGSTITPAHVP